ALRGEVEDEAEAEEAIARPDEAQIRCAGGEHLRVGAEESEPRARPECRSDADRLGDAERERAADERDAQGALALAGTDVRADERHEWRAEAEDERNEQVLEPRAGAVACDRAGATVRADERGRQHDRERGLQRAHGADAAD